MTKKAKIFLSLVKEANETSNNEIEKEIFDSLRKTPLIPWMSEVLQVRVEEE